MKRNVVLTGTRGTASRLRFEGGAVDFGGIVRLYLRRGRCRGSRGGSHALGTWL